MTRILRAAVAVVFFASLQAGVFTGPALAQSSSMSSSTMKSSTSCPVGESYVKGYTKSDGTKVAGYCRKSPSSMTTTCPKGDTYVKPYKKSDGTMVKGYCRKSSSMSGSSTTTH